ncbi:MAG: LysR family transcriptional regulator [Hespellia sp.]|nr:LysR family transcriptional regulator [Hespellia sp.]
MDFLQLKYFSIVANMQSFTQAAKKLYISQSSLSQTIGHLEKELGYQLFDRHGKTIELNEAGKVFLAGIESMQEKLKDTLRQIDEINGIQAKEISLYIGCASLALPGLLSQLRKQCGEITFRILQMRQTDVQPNTDFSIVGQNELTKDTNAILLLEEDIRLAVPKEHKLTGKKIIQWNDLEHENFIALNKEWSLGNLLDTACNDNGFSPNITVRVDNPSMMRTLLKEKMGIAFIPQKTWNSPSVMADLCLKKIEHLELKRYVYLKWRKDSYLTDTMKTCRNCIQEYFQNI